MNNYIDVYTREDAINDGVLQDVTLQAKEAGIKYPTALTAGVVALINDKPEHEDIEGRTWDIVWMLSCAIRGTITSKKIGQDKIIYKLILNDKSTYKQDHPELKEVELKALVHGGDNCEPVITIMTMKETGEL